MSWQKDFNSLFTDSFFRFLFGFTIIIALSFGVVVLTDVFFGDTSGNAQTATVSK